MKKKNQMLFGALETLFQEVSKKDRKTTRRRYVNQESVLRGPRAPRTCILYNNNNSDKRKN